MSKINGVLEPDIQKRIYEIYENQMAAFGGSIRGNELKEIFFKDGYHCVRFQCGDWYHYDLKTGTWW